MTLTLKKIKSDTEIISHPCANIEKIVKNTITLLSFKMIDIDFNYLELCDHNKLHPSDVTTMINEKLENKYVSSYPNFNEKIKNLLIKFVKVGLIH